MLWVSFSLFLSPYLSLYWAFIYSLYFSLLLSISRVLCFKFSISLTPRFSLYYGVSSLFISLSLTSFLLYLISLSLSLSPRLSLCYAFHLSVIKKPLLSRSRNIWIGKFFSPQLLFEHQLKMSKDHLQNNFGNIEYAFNKMLTTSLKLKKDPKAKKIHVLSCQS